MDLQSKYQPCETHSFQSQASSLPALKLRSFLGLPSQTLLGALPQTPPGTSPWTLPRFARFEAAWPYSGRISKEKAISPSPLMWYGGCTSAPQELMPPTPRTAPQTHSTVRRSGGSSSWCVAFSSSSAV